MLIAKIPPGSLKPPSPEDLLRKLATEYRADGEAVIKVVMSGKVAVLESGADGYRRCIVLQDNIQEQQQPVLFTYVCSTRGQFELFMEDVRRRHPGRETVEISND